MNNGEVKYDFDFLNKISGGDKSFILEMVTTFKEMIPGFIENSIKFLKEKNYDALSKEVHKFIPGVTFLGINYMKDDLTLLEEYAKKQENIEELPELLDNTIIKVKEIVNIFEKEFNV